MTLPELHRPAWQEHAACRGMGPEAWFPGRGPSEKAGNWRPPALCAACVVRAQCLDYALRHRIAYGTWGGESERSRRRILKIKGHKYPGWRDDQAS